MKTILPKPNCDTGARCVSLFNEYHAGKITIDEFDYALALVTLDILNDYRYRPLPIRPKALQDLRDTTQSDEWRRMKLADRDALKNRIYGYDNVIEYLEKKRETISSNDSDHRWLSNVRDIFNKMKNRPAELKVSQKIREFITQGD